MLHPIVLEGLTKKYGTYDAVKDLNFAIAQGSTVGLLGCNGAGKTTTIAMIMGLVLPTSGRVKVLGFDMSKYRHKVLKSMNFQSPYVSMPAQLTVWENLNIFGRLYGVANLKTRIEEVAHEFGLTEVIKRQTGKLSAGQRTRASLAKALINKPQILLLDEPTASLDPERADWVREHLRAYQKQYGATILLSSHNMVEVEQLCDRVVIMSYGRVVEIGATREVIRQNDCAGLADVFLTFARRTEATNIALDLARIE